MIGIFVVGVDWWGVNADALGRNNLTNLITEEKGLTKLS